MVQSLLTEDVSMEGADLQKIRYDLIKLLNVIII